MTDEITPENDDDVTDEAILQIFREQAAHLEQVRHRLRRMPSAVAADDNPALMTVIRQLQKIRQIIDDIEDDINQRNNQ